MEEQSAKPNNGHNGKNINKYSTLESDIWPNPV
jgi:hypothetical protein